MEVIVVPSMRFKDGGGCGHSAFIHCSRISSSRPKTAFIDASSSHAAADIPTRTATIAAAAAYTSAAANTAKAASKSNIIATTSPCMPLFGATAAIANLRMSPNNVMKIFFLPDGNKQSSPIQSARVLKGQRLSAIILTISHYLDGTRQV